MAVEIERKFLVRSDAWRGLAKRTERFRQGYLSSGSRCSIRVRTAGEQAWLNLKSKVSGMSRLEYEYEVPAADANEILDRLCDGPIIDKERHWIEAGRHTWEVDVFHGANEGLVVAEIELEREDEAIDPPVWVGEEVTHDERYYNFNLAKHPYSEWS